MAVLQLTISNKTIKPYRHKHQVRICYVISGDLAGNGYRPERPGEVICSPWSRLVAEARRSALGDGVMNVVTPRDRGNVTAALQQRETAWETGRQR